MKKFLIIVAMGAIVMGIIISLGTIVHHKDNVELIDNSWDEATTYFEEATTYFEDVTTTW